MRAAERRWPRPDASDVREDAIGAAARRDRWFAVAIVIGATTFNAVLAMASARGLPISSGAVIGCEVLLTGAALVLGLNGRLPLARAWVGICGVLGLFALVNGFGTGGFDPKFVRDVLIIPVFVLLGLRCGPGDVIRTVIILQILVVAVMVFEAVRPEAFGQLFDIAGYYIRTRGFQAANFWNQSSDLFISATRPGERFLLGGLGIHRLSSVFLEPVSLGNYCVVVAIVSAALWPRLGRLRRAFLVVSEAMILVGCDGRFATVAVALVVVMAVAAPHLPRYSNVLYLPLVVFAAALAVTAFAISPEGDDFASRAAGSIETLSLMSLPDLFGLSTFTAYRVMDSGIAYLLFSQSLLGAAVIWGFITLGLPQDSRAAIVAAHGVALYVALLLLISYSLFSIKTAALLWFSFAAIARPAPAAAPGTREPALAGWPKAMPA